MTTVWRAHLRPEGIEPIAAHTFCIERDIVGAGWAVNANAPLAEDEYRALANVVHGEPARDNRRWVGAINALAVHMVRDDLCWVRHPQTGDCYIGRIGGTWEYRSTQEYRAVGIVNVRPCFWLGPAELPDGVSFRMGPTFRRAPARAVAPSIAAYNRLSTI